MCRELSSSNLELRKALQQNESKLLECGGVPSSKRKHLVYHHLVDKEEELATMKRENKFLHSELEHLRLLSTRRLPSFSSSPSSSSSAAANVTKGGGGLSSPSAGNYSNSNNASRLKPIPSVDKAATVRQSNHHVSSPGDNRYNPSRYKPTADRPNDITFMMSKEEAKMVILSEVRRLKDSHAVLQANRNQLNNKVLYSMMSKECDLSCHVTSCLITIYP